MAGGIPGYKIILNIFISIINFNLAGSVVVIVHPAEVGVETTLFTLGSGVVDPAEAGDGHAVPVLETRLHI